MFILFFLGYLQHLFGQPQCIYLRHHTILAEEFLVRYLLHFHTWIHLANLTFLPCSSPEFSFWFLVKKLGCQTTAFCHVCPCFIFSYFRSSPSESYSPSYVKISEAAASFFPSMLCHTGDGSFENELRY